MARKRIMAWALLLAATVSVRVAVASPRTAAAELRALVCCAEHCPPERRLPMRAQRCCGVATDAQAPATLLSPVADGASPLASAALVRTAAIMPAPSLDARVATPAARITGPPPFRRTQKLQR